MSRTSVLTSISSDQLRFWGAAAFLAFVFLTGGGARADIISLILLRPAAGAYLAYGLWRVEWAQLKPHRLPVILLGGAAAIAVLQLIPLPPLLWHAFPGHAIVAEIDRTVGVDSPWRPISLTPADTANALFALLPPAALLVNLATLEQRDQLRFLQVLLVLCAISGLLGVAQVLGGRGSGLYLYRVTNRGFAVGLFSNRNHQAIVLACCFPLLAAFALRGRGEQRQARSRMIVAVAGAAALVPLILVTGSRTGLVTGVVGLLAAMLLYQRFATDKTRGSAPAVARRWIPWAAAGAVIVLAAVTAYFSRAEVFNRFADGDTLDSVRFRVWLPILEIATGFLPFGSGLGSFSDIYKMYEPNELLRPTYLNHAHNDWLEVLLTAGLPGLALMVVAVVGYLRIGLRVIASRRRGAEALTALAGAAIVVVIAVGSIADYPLRSPSIACIFMVVSVWLPAISGGSVKIPENSSLSTDADRSDNAEQTSF